MAGLVNAKTSYKAGQLRPSVTLKLQLSAKMNAITQWNDVYSLIC